VTIIRLSTDTTEDKMTARQSRLITSGVLGIGAVVLAQTAAQLINYKFFDLRLKVIDSSGDGGLFGILGILASVLAAAAAWGALPRLPEARRLLVMLAPLLTFLATDKALRLHDDVPNWLAVYAPLLAAALVLLLLFAHQTNAEARRLIFSALVLLAVAFLIHQFGNPALERLHDSTADWLHAVKGVTKHGAELAGWLLVGLGVVAACAGEPEHRASTRRKTGSSC